MAISSVSPLGGLDPEFCLGNLKGRGWPRRLTQNQPTLLGFSSLLETLVPSFPTFTEPKIRGECSDSPAPRLPAAQKKLRL